MPFQVEFENIPVGYAAKAARAGDKELAVQYAGFSTSEDGAHFIKLLDGLPNAILGLLQRQCNVDVRASQVDHLLAMISANRTAAVYLNELKFGLQCRASRPIQAGELVRKDDIVDVARMDVGVSIPNDCGVLFLFSVGWRKALFFDLGPVLPDRDVGRSFRRDVVFGQLYACLLFQERFNIQEVEWLTLFNSRLFPFAGLDTATIEAILEHIRAGWDVAELSDKVTDEVRRKLPSFLNAWRAHPTFAPHIEVVERSSERFLGGDSLSALSIIVPRIEGAC